MQRFDADVVVVGGGLAGVRTVDLLVQSGISTILIEAKNVCDQPCCTNNCCQDLFFESVIQLLIKFAFRDWEEEQKQFSGMDIHLMLVLNGLPLLHFILVLTA